MTELIWKDKHDATGRRNAPLQIALPFQTIETVNESAEDRVHSQQLFMQGMDSEWRNRLIWGDKKYVLPSLLEEFAGKVDLIYIDPPFATGADFSFTARIPDSPDSFEYETTEFTKQPSGIEMKAYRDTWSQGLDSYLKWFYETVVYLRELLKESGSIYVHLDYNICHYAKVVLDEVFSSYCFKNEIIWQKLTSAKPQSSTYPNIHDVIYYYSKSAKYIFNKQYLEKNEKLLQTHYRHVDERTGKRYSLDNFTQSGQGEPRQFGDQILAPPPGKHWIWSQERINAALEENLIVFSSSGMPYVKRFYEDTKGHMAEDIWLDLNPVNPMAKERVGYPTQKPESLLERIIKTSSNEDDLILDCFCGSGTTAAVAEKHGRRWITSDLGRFAIHTTRKRLLEISELKPFVVQNLGKYERQVWQSAEFGEDNIRRQLNYRSFVLELYHANPLQGYSWLHGLKNGRMVHVGAVDSPVTESDVTNLAIEFRQSIGKGMDSPTSNGIDILGWDFAFELNELAKIKAQEAGLDIKFKKIPLDVMDPRAVKEGDIQFFELAALEVKQSITNKKLLLELANFIIPQDELPEEVRDKISHWQQWVDYWAVDWNYQNDTFHNQWQSYRTRKDQTLILKASYSYEDTGIYTVMIKVVDILGNDTTKMIKVEVR